MFKIPTFRRKLQSSSGGSVKTLRLTVVLTAKISSQKQENRSLLSVANGGLFVFRRTRRIDISRCKTKGMSLQVILYSFRDQL